VIDQKVKGFIVDQDGKIGLRGKVVAKMGSMIARAALAGFASGVGDAVSQSYTVQSISPLGATSSVSSNDVAQYGAATGAASALKEISKFYLCKIRSTLDTQSDLNWTPNPERTGHSIRF
jgi:conjugal transfer pilus assembly protein TraB